MPRFYFDSPLITDQILDLPHDVVRHILVLRLKLSDSITLFNGDGSTYQAHIVAISRKTVSVKIIKQIKNHQQINLDIHLLLCIIANDKMDLAIQKAVEIGVAEITPVISERSQKLHSDKVAKRMAHWQKIIISSCEQCGNNTIPKLNYPKAFGKLLASAEVNLIMSTSESTLTNNSLPNQSSPKLVQLLVGPEGGFSQTEQVEGFVPLRLGNMILRSETAVIAGLSYVQLKYGSWQSLPI